MLVRSLRAVHAHLIEQSLETVIVLPVIYKIDGVGFHIRLTHHIESILIAEPVQIIVIAVVGCTDRIDVILFHHHYVFQIHILRNHPSVERICVMTVCSLQKQRLPVDLHGIPCLCRHIVILVYLRGCKGNLTESEL